MKIGKKTKALACLVALTACFGGAAFAQFTPSEIKEREYWEYYLQTARIVGGFQMSVEKGITQPWVLTLIKNGRIHKAIWKPVEGLHKGYSENWRWEIAAYRLDKYLGLNMIPPTVERVFRKTRGSLQLWIDSRMSLRQMIEENRALPRRDALNWIRMMSLQRTFDNLIANEDRHLGNYLITSDWRVILIDHSRSFRTSGQFTENLIFNESWEEEGLEMKQLPRSFVEKIKALDFETIKNVAGCYLTDGEILAVLKRRDLILHEIERIIGARGPYEVQY